MNVDDAAFLKVYSNVNFRAIKKLGLSYNSELTDEVILGIIDNHSELSLEILELDSTGISDEGNQSSCFLSHV